MRYELPDCISVHTEVADEEYNVIHTHMRNTSPHHQFYVHIGTKLGKIKNSGIWIGDGDWYVIKPCPQDTGYSESIFFDQFINYIEVNECPLWKYERLYERDGRCLEDYIDVLRDAQKMAWRLARECEI